MNQFEKDLHILKKNRENVPIEDLKGKYKKAYLKLLNRLKEEYKTWVLKVLLCQVYIDPEEKGDFLDRLSAWMKIPQTNNLLQKVTKEVFQKYNTEEASMLLIKLEDEMLNQVYAPFFMKHCVNKNGSIYNTLIEMYYVPETQTWVSEGGSCILEKGYEGALVYPFKISKTAVI